MTTQNSNVIEVDERFRPRTDNGPDYEHFWTGPDMGLGDRLQDAMEQVADPVREVAHTQPIAVAFGTGIAVGAALVYLTLIIMKLTGV